MSTYNTFNFSNNLFHGSKNFLTLKFPVSSQSSEHYWLSQDQLLHILPELALV